VVLAYFIILFYVFICKAIYNFFLILNKRVYILILYLRIQTYLQHFQMKRQLFLPLLILMSFNLFAQKRVNDLKIEHFKGQEVVCPARFVDNPSFVDMPEVVKHRMANKNARVGTNQAATFIVNYVGFPDNAKAAFQRAVDIWANLLNSTIPVRVTAIWEDLGQNVLGSANTSDYLRNFPGANKINTFYPIALAEKMSGIELNSLNDEDIICRFNSRIPWYYGTAENVPLGQFDFTSIVLHELGHGLGFVGSMRVSGNIGSYGFGTRFNTIYDSFLKSGDDKFLVDTLSFRNPSNALRNPLVSEDLYFVSPRTDAVSKSDRVLLYAPNPYQPGSSISHLDDFKYGGGKINSLMTPTASLREKNLNPGPITLNMFADMGWKGTSISHERLKDITKTEKIKIEAKILTDTTLVANTAKVFYLFNNLPASATNIKEANLVFNAATGNYEANIDIPVGTGTVDYYLSVEDNFGAKVTSPANGGFGATNFIWGFDIGKPDFNGPVIEHYAPEILPAVSPVSLIANVIDDFQDGIDTVYVVYNVNGTQRPNIGLKKYNVKTDNQVFSQGRADNNAFLAENAINNLRAGDKVKYQIVAIDKSGNKTVLPTIYAGNTTTEKPAETFYEFTVTTISNTVVDEYETNFENADEDFSLLGFSIAQPADFSNKGLHTSHPYTNGLGLLDPVSGFPYLPFDKNELALLRKPIRLKSTDATITFDQIVLVEPGDAGSSFGNSNFYDFVVVEGSLDGSFWFPLQDGYDSRVDVGFENLFKSAFTGGDAPQSTAKGTQRLFKKQTINIYGSDFTSEFAGEQLLVRFRLYADQWAAGWGWAIDNLFIQKAAPIILANEPSNIKGLTVFPNPSSELLNLKLDLDQPQNVKVEIFSLKGSYMYSEEIPFESGIFEHQININRYTPGAYMLRITEKRGQMVKRFVVAEK
jgi:hypothetical protein